jgi:PTH1 family peptidyl-tRNA hydrolase
MSIFDIFDRIAKKDAESEVREPISFLIVGLGNDGDKYKNTKHNVGFKAVEKLAEKYGTQIKKGKFNALVGECRIAGRHCLLMKPLTFMNKSGEAITAAMEFYKVPIENVIVIYDDISLDPSIIRVRRKGTDGGHNGIKSVITCTGSIDFPRIKIGVGNKPHPDYDLSAWVLSDFSEEAKSQVEEAYEKACRSVELIIEGKIDMAMNEYNNK